jgi:hypothetical protein
MIEAVIVFFLVLVAGCFLASWFTYILTKDQDLREAGIITGKSEENKKEIIFINGKRYIEAD